MRLRIGRLLVDMVTFDQAIGRIVSLAQSGKGGAVFTPNVDHVVLAETHPGFREAYARAALSLADGMPLVWASHLLGHPLPAKVSGSDLLVPLIERARDAGLRVYFLGAAEGVAARAAEVLAARFPGLIVAGVDSPRITLNPSNADRAGRREVVERVKAARPDLVLVALGAPKQELWIDEVTDDLRPAVLLGIGASLDFVAGTVRRAPAIVSRIGLEWLYRLGQEPKRLWRRYLLQDPKFAAIVLRALRSNTHERVVRE